MTMESEDRKPENTGLTREEAALFERVKLALSEHEVVGMEHKIRKSAGRYYVLNHRILRLAATILILVSVSLTAWHLSVPKNKRVFNHYYMPYNSDDITGVYRDAETGKSIGIHFYTQHQYEDARPLFEDYLAHKPDDGQVKLLLAICHMEGNDLQKAEAILTEMADAGQAYFLEDALWYLSLTYLKTGFTEKALACLDKLKDSRHYGPKALSKKKKIGQ